MLNPHEAIARERKALALAQALEAAGCTSSEAESGTDDEWAMAAQLAGVNFPSAETRRVVVSMMRSRERQVRNG